MSITPPANPDIKRELKDQLLTLSPRAFELFAGDFLVYAGLDRVSVTRYIGDGGIDAEGDLIAGPFCPMPICSTHTLLDASVEERKDTVCTLRQRTVEILDPLFRKSSYEHKYRRK